MVTASDGMRVRRMYPTYERVLASYRPDDSGIVISARM
jgi:hypothetical protein